MLKMADIIKTFGLIRITYPNSYQTKTDEEEQMLYELWYDIFKEYPREVFLAAVKNAIKNSEFAPKPATIIKDIEKMQAVFNATDGELWAELKGVLREVAHNVYRFRFTYREENGKTQGENARIRVKEIFNGLSPELKEYVRDPQGLIEISGYTNEQLAYERGRFMRIMPEVKQRAKTRREMPDGLAGLLQGLTVNFSIESDDTKQLLPNGENNAPVRNK